MQQLCTLHVAIDLLICLFKISENIKIEYKHKIKINISYQNALLLIFSSSHLLLLFLRILTLHYIYHEEEKCSSKNQR